MTIYRHIYRWTGFNGAPGYSNFYAAPDVDESNWGAATQAFFTAIKPTLPQVVTIQSTGVIDELDESTGALTGSAAIGSLPAIVGDVGGAYSGPTGAVVSWLTAGIVNKRRVRGRTFIVPLAAGVYDSDGTINVAPLTVIRDAADNYTLAMLGTQVVWHRPSGSPPGGGSAHVVTGATVPDLAAVLRSRRG